MPEFVLALDCGTTSVKALIMSADGRPRAVARRPIVSQFPAPGLVEQDAASVWALCRAVVAESLAVAGIAARDLAAVGITSQRASIVLFDTATGEPVAPMVVWSDTRGLARAASLQSDGFMVWPQTPACKLEAVLACVPDGAARAARGTLRFGTLDTYLGYRLSAGAMFVTDVSNGWASGYTDYFQAGGVWNAALIAHQGLPAALFPAIVDTYGVCGTTSAAVLGAAVPIAAIVADQQGGLFGHAGLDDGGWKASFGTSAVVIAATGARPGTPHNTMPPQALLRVDGATSYCVEGMVVTAGVLLDWLSAGLGLFADSAALCASAGSSARGVAIRPSLQGLGAPHGMLHARAVVAGLSPGSDRAAIARAALEGVAFRTAEIVAIMRDAGIGGDILPVDGGVATSDLFCRLVADFCQVPVRRHAVREGAAYGAAVAASLGVGLSSVGDLAALARYENFFEPTLSADEAASRASAWRATLAG